MNKFQRWIEAKIGMIKTSSWRAYARAFEKQHPGTAAQFGSLLYNAALTARILGKGKDNFAEIPSLPGVYVNLDNDHYSLKIGAFLAVDGTDLDLSTSFWAVMKNIVIRSLPLIDERLFYYFYNLVSNTRVKGIHFDFSDEQIIRAAREDPYYHS